MLFVPNGQNFFTSKKVAKYRSSAKGMVITMENIFDSHCHYDDDKFRDDLEYTMQMLQKNGVCNILHASTCVESANFGVELSNKYDFAYTSVGIHPEEVFNLQADYLKVLENLATHNKKVVAIGEIGLDYYWTKDTKEKQLLVFEEQLVLAKKLDLPVIIHCREATADCLDILKNHRPRGVIHCFSGSVETARILLDLGFYISLTGVVTFNNAKTAQQVAEFIPKDRLLLETDAPYMAPVPFRGKRCTSDLIAHTAEKIAEIKAMQTQDLIDICTQNTKDLFSIC